MFVRNIVADAFATNCYLVAPQAGQECLIIDPGVGVAAQLSEVMAEHRLRPAAVLATHAHLDHVASVTPVCGGALAAYLHGGDRYRLDDPYATLSPELTAALEQQFGKLPTWREPENVVEIAGGQTLELAGLQVGVVHAPGHTEGSVLFTAAGLPDGIPGEDLDRTMFSGDVLFAGSIGRTDLPGGDAAAMQRSLREVVLTQPDSTLVLPGHGGGTTIARERVSNPFLIGLENG